MLHIIRILNIKYSYWFVDNKLSLFKMTLSGRNSSTKISASLSAWAFFCRKFRESAWEKSRVNWVLLGYFYMVEYCEISNLVFSRNSRFSEGQKIRSKIPPRYYKWLKQSKLWLSAIFCYSILKLADSLISALKVSLWKWHFWAEIRAPEFRPWKFHFENDTFRPKFERLNFGPESVTLKMTFLGQNSSP